MSNLDKDWIAVAQVYATLSAGYRTAAAMYGAPSTRHVTPSYTDESKAINSASFNAKKWEELAEAAIRAAGVEG